MRDYANVTRTTGDTSEHVICAKPCVLYGIYPELTTTGTITVRNAAATGGSAVIHVCAIGLLQAGKTFGRKGIYLSAGCTVQLSVASDLSAIAWEPVGPS